SACRLATATFHQYPYSGTSFPWRQEYTPSFLWGAFSGVPLADQGSLYDTLQHYARTTQERIAAATEYHRNLREADGAEAVDRILTDVLIPLFDQSIGRDAGRLVLATRHELIHPPVRLVERMQLAGRQLRRLLTLRPRVQVTPRTSSAIVRAGGTIRVADWLNTFIQTIDPDPAVVARVFGET